MLMFITRCGFITGLLYGADGSVRSVRRWRSEPAVTQLQTLPQVQQQSPAGVPSACPDCAPDAPTLRRVHTMASGDRLATTLLLGDRELIRLYNSSSQRLSTALRLTYASRAFYSPNSLRLM